MDVGSISLATVVKHPTPSIPLSETYPNYERAMRKKCMKSKFEQRLRYTTRLQQGETPEAILDDLISLLQDAKAYSDRNSYHQALDIYAQVIDARLARSEEHTSELQSQSNIVCRLLLA